LWGALQRGDRAPFDVVWCNGVAALRARASGFCEPLSDLDGLERLASRALPTGAPVAEIVFPYVVYYVLVYACGFHPEPPRSWSALCDERQRGRVVLYPGGNGLFPIAQVMGGGQISDIPDAMEPCWRFVRSLGPQVGELDYSIGMERAWSEGRVTSCMRALTNALAFRAAGLDVSWVVPEEGTSDTLDALWVPRGLPRARSFWARRLVEFCLRADVQERLCELLGCMPVNEGARPPALLTDNPRLPNAADDLEPLLYIPDTLKLQYAAEWEQRFALELAAGRALHDSRPSSPPARHTR
jgi:putative spermidine/putrescine transport system substrate-binding protein